MKNATVAMHRASAHAGMEIEGIDLREPLSEQAYGEIRHALCDTGVIFFRDQDITPAHQAAFAARFGDCPDAEFVKTVEGFPQIGKIAKEPDQRRNVGGNWHSDQSFDRRAPLGSVLYGQELPDSGGDTLFANMCSAYDSLSDGLKETLSGLRAIHAKAQAWRSDQRPDRATSAATIARHDEEFKDRQCSHPVVALHPETGRKILFINPTYTVRFEGWTEGESRPLLDYLFAHATAPENTCRFTWREGSLVFWDNRTALHYAVNDYHGQRRVMHRIAVYGPGIE